MDGVRLNNIFDSGSWSIPCLQFVFAKEMVDICGNGRLVVSDTMFYEDIIEIVVVVVEYELIVEVYKDSKDKEYVLR